MEENPFKEKHVAQEWIRSVEGERGLIRDKEFYPRLREWSKTVQGTIVDIGAGQGIASEKIDLENKSYVGIEPSEPLVIRAKEKYQRSNSIFMVGDAYHLPLPEKTADGVVSINVWFHLENLPLASRELARILKPGGKFFLITANPDAQKSWDSFYYDERREGKTIVGKVHLPVNPQSKSIFWKHTKGEILGALAQTGLKVTEQENIGRFEQTGENLFLLLIGEKESLP